MISNPIVVQCYSSFEALPERFLAFLGKAARRSFFYDVAWFCTIQRTVGPATDEPRIYVAQLHGEPVAALITRERKAAGKLKAHMLLSVSRAMYTPLYGPILGADFGIEGLRAIVMEIVHTRPFFDVLRFDSLDRQSPEFFALSKVLREVGMCTQYFFNFFNYYEDVPNLTAMSYLSSRSPRLRNYITGRLRRWERLDRGYFRLITGDDGLSSALIDFELVHVQSWKEPEAFPGFIPELSKAAARAGILRLGLIYVDDEPAAAQLWIVHGGQATIIRSHHAKKYAKLSMGSVLTFEMIRHLLDVDNIREIDGGCSGETYQGKWFNQRRERAGIIAFNPRRVRGLILATWHIGGHMALSVMRRFRIALPRRNANLRRGEWRVDGY